MCDAPNLGADGVCTNQVPNNRAYCCNAQVCVNANQGEAAYNNICITQAGGQMQCGCCGVNNQNCCQF
jgi:hypothetical protein